MILPAWLHPILGDDRALIGFLHREHWIGYRNSRISVDFT